MLENRRALLEFIPTRCVTLSDHCIGRGHSKIMVKDHDCWFQIDGQLEGEYNRRR